MRRLPRRRVPTDSAHAGALPASGDRPGRELPRPAGWLAVLAVLVVGAVAADVLAGGLLTRLDHQVSHVMRDWGLRDMTWPRRGLRLLTFFGQRGPVLAVAIPLTGWIAWRARSMEPLARLAVALVLLTCCAYALKLGLRRDAPPVDGLGTGTGRSFPSGHLANSVLVWGLLAWLGARDAWATPACLRRALLIVRIAGPVLVVIGMTLLDYHWISDFVAGAALGVVLLWAATLPWAARPSAEP